MREQVLVLDLGVQVNQMAARRIRDCDVYCSVVGADVSSDKIKEIAPKAIVLTGGRADLQFEADDNLKAVLAMGYPVLALGNSAKIVARILGEKPGAVAAAGEVTLSGGDNTLWQGVGQAAFYMEKGAVIDIPKGYEALAVSGTERLAACDNKNRIYLVYCNPEYSKEAGRKIFQNFLYKVAGMKPDWTMEQFAQSYIAEAKQKIGDKKVLLALSGGVDSSVCAALLSKAIGKNLTCIFVDHGFMRKDEGDQIEAVFGTQFESDFVRVNAQDRFLEKVKGVSDPEQKRKIIGAEFIRVFEDEAKKLGKIHFLCQGTIYPDVIESGIGNKKGVKSHHNVGGLPDHVDFEEIIEPLYWLFKDEVRKLGTVLGLPDTLTQRQPFPGPGLAVRVIGEITFQKLEILREADAIFREELDKAGLNKQINQYFAVITGLKSVGVRNEERTYDYIIALRAVVTSDFMTAAVAEIPYEILLRAGSRIANEVKGAGRVVYDVTGKPPATIEWE